MIQLRDIYKSYNSGKNRFEALKGISLSFRNNEFAAILGPSGSGKTTLLNVIGGLDHYDSGDLIVDQISTRNYSDRDWDSYRNHTIGFIFQNYNLIPHQTILSNVEMALTISGVSKKERKARAAKALERVGLAGQMNRLPAQLSGGQMQRVAIARALVNNPSIILADEPTGALDSTTSIQVMELIKEVSRDHLVIMVTHNAELAEQYATRIITLRDGQITADSNPMDVTEDTEKLVSKNMGHASMKLSTAFSLSAHNLWSKRKRSVLTAFAGSIGIIGIALILALSTGVNGYISSMEDSMAYAYPLLVDTVSLDLSSAIEDLDMLAPIPNSDHVEVISFVDRIRTMLGTNDLSNLKAWLDKKEHDLSQYGIVEYMYSVQPQIYLEYGDTVRCVCPDSTLDATGLPLTSIDSSLLSSQISTTMFSCMPKHEELYKENYDVKAGRLPENKNECVLVLAGDGRIVDYLLYVLGMRDPSELDEMIQSFLNGEFKSADATEPETYEYTDFLGRQFKLVKSSDYYVHHDESDLWIDNKGDAEFLKQLVKNGEDLEIVGVVQPSNQFGTGCLQPGICYPYSLLESTIEEASQSEIVKAQLADPKTNVFTGLPFDNAGSTENLNLASMITVDVDALKKAVMVNQDALISTFFQGSGLSEKLTPDLLEEVLSSIDADQLRDYMSGIIGDYVAYLQEQGYLDYEYYTKAAAEYFQSDDFYEVLEKWVRSLSGKDLTLNALADEIDALSSSVSLGLKGYMEKHGFKELPAFDQTILDYAATGRILKYTEQYEKEHPDSSLKQAKDLLKEKLGDELLSSVEDGVRALLEKGTDGLQFDQKAFFSAFDLNISPDALSELLMSMTNLSAVSYSGNLHKMGYDDSEHPYSIRIYTSSYDNKEAAIAVLDSYNEEMEAASRSGDTITYTDTLGSVIQMIMRIVDIITAVLVAAVTISLFVASIMIGVITYISVLERRKEIGILRAMGASRRNISQIFRAETFITGLLSGAIGIAVSYLLLLPMNAFIHASTQIYDINAFLPAVHALILIAVGALLTTLGGLLPAHGASKSDPVEALKSE